MNRHFTLIFNLGLSLVLLVGPLLPTVSGGDRLLFSNRPSSRKPDPASRAPRKLSVRKNEKGKVATEQEASRVAPWQTATLLADGRWLLVGGEGELMATAAILDSQTGEIKSLASKPLHPRMGHSATVLSDGTVLILGGIGTQGPLVDRAEIFNPETQGFEASAAAGLSPRVNHTSTLLTNGKLLIAGGTDIRGKLSTKVELWDPQKRGATVLRSRLQTGRQKHVAAIQADGTVVLSGGTDANGNSRSDAEIYEPESESFSSTATPTTTRADAPPRLEFSAPSNGAMEVDENTLIALRFSEALSVKSVNRESVVLHGPHGEVPARVIAAEAGMLVFVTPLAPLAGNSNYNLTITGASDQDQTALPFVDVGFKTKCTADASSETRCGGAAPQIIDFDSWIPDGKNLNGDWRSGRADVKAQSEPALQAAPGETALAGKVLTLSGTPLANVTLQVGDRTAGTDHMGRFLLSSLQPGRHVLTIQGHTASRPGKTYGTFDVLVDVTAGKTTVLPYTIWLPVLDEQNVTRLPIPTVRETSVTTSRIPGMEVRVPSNAVLRMPSGKHHMHGMMKRELTSVAITPIPVDRPPFPLPPGVDDGLLFTLQLHGARVEGLNGEKRPGLRIVFPNYQNLPAGSRVDFWNYDAENGAGWYMYGHGTVTADRRQVVPDPGVELQSMHCISLMNKVGGPGVGPAPGNGTTDGDPVDLGTGLFVYNKTDLILPDVIPISLTRTYRQNDSEPRSFGKGATIPYDMFILGDTYNYGQIVLPDGGRIRFDKIPDSSPAVYEHTATPTRYYKATMRIVSGVGPNGAWEVRLTDGTIYQFGIKVLYGNIFGPQSSTTGLSAIQDRYGNRLTITRDDSFRMTKVSSPNGRWISFTYSDASKRVAQATDNKGRMVSYIYDANGRLWKVTDAKGGITEYTYDSSDRMLTIKDPRGIVFLTNQYDANGRVFRQTQADTSTYEFAYAVDGSGKVTQTDVTNPRGFVRRVTFNSAGYTLTDTLALGAPEQQTYTYERQVGTNFILSVTDPLGRKTALAYNAQGNVTSFTQLADTSGAAVTTITYEPTYNLIAAVTDPLGHTVSYGYSVRGSLTSVTDALGHKTRYQYNAAAQPTSAIDALGNATHFNHSLGIRVEAIDPLGHSTRQEIDAAGRTTSVTNPLGDVTRYEHDNLNQQTQGIDHMGGVTAFTYDGNGNLLTVTDARNSVTSYIYNSMDRIVTRRDPLQHDDTYEYDLNGNLKKVTDRKGQITTFSYDALDRLAQVSYPDASTATYTYDSVNRLLQVADSVTGTIMYSHDNLDRLTSETTPQGTVTYTYDSAGRRTSMNVTGQPTINYTYDDANRLTQITQATSTVLFVHDAVGRRTSVTLPNGVSTEYSYDAASRLTGLTYKQGQTVLGNLTYDYDQNNQRTRMAGSFARMVSSQPLTSATYNAANQQMTFGSQTLTYDLNGNLTSDGTNNFTWDARNRLVAINGPGVSAAFSYDSFGRRVSKTVDGVTTTVVYDGFNTVQEQSATLGNANLLNGGLDEVFGRNVSGGTWSPLRDGLGSSLSLTDSSGAIQTEYSYGAFGQSAITGPLNNNPSQYTGRENDGTGLYHYRARYYSPTLQRFISSDPIGFRSGEVNLYAYVGNSPLNFIDPSGLDGTTPTQPSSSQPTTYEMVRDWLLIVWNSGIPYRLGVGQSTTMPVSGGGEMVGVLQLGPELYKTGKIVQERNDKINEALRCAQGGSCGPDNGSGPQGSPNPNRPPSGMPDPASPDTSNPYNLPPNSPGNYGPDLNGPSGPGNPNPPSLAGRKT